MDFRRVRAFVVLAEELHFGRAADRLGISQPPLSLQIRQLEEELGAPLFARTSRRVALTEVGEAFLGEARDVLRRANLAVATARRAAAGEIGELKVGLTGSLPLMGRVPRILRTFREARPDVHLTLVEQLSQEQVIALENGTLHIGFLRTPGIEPVAADTIASIAIGSDELVLFLPHADARAGPADRAVDLAVFAEESFVFYEQDVGTALRDPLIAMCAAAGFVPRIVQTAREPTTILGLVSAGFGVTVLPSSFARMAIEGVAARSIADGAPPITSWLAYRRGSTSPLTAAFRAVAASAIAQER